jgi:hypothetical protein
MKKIKKKPLLIALFVLLGLVGLSLAIYFLYFQDDSIDKESPKNNRYEELEDGYALYTGDVISAKLPSGWRIIEYLDGKNASSLDTAVNNYSGLTGIEILSDDSRTVFSFQGVSNIDFSMCPTYPQFKDSSQEHLEEKRAQSEDLGDMFDVIDYKDSEYVEIALLGRRVRRMGGQYFYDTKPDNEYFEPLCVERVLTLDELHFTDEQGNKYQTYAYGPTENSTEEDLLIIDEILESIEVNNG